MTKKKLTVNVGSLKDSLSRFKNVWERSEQGEKIELANILSFESMPLLIKALSPKRLELLQALHVLGTVSIRKLALELGRDYRNVHQDVKELYNIGVILMEDDKFYTPWTSIVTEFPLCTPKLNKHHHQKHSHNPAA